MLNPVTPDLETRLRGALPGAVFRDIAPRYLEEPRGIWAGQAGLVLAPGTTEEVSVVLRAAAETETPVVPYGGGTGVVGGQIAPEGRPIILSLERMARIRAVHPEDAVIIAEAGVTLAAVQEAARSIDRLFPLSYGSEGSAQIGAALSVNSGGINVLRYGTARDLCLGIEAVLPSGEILRGLKRLRKDNTGYDIRNLLIGAEGTLGVITAASLRLAPRPTSTATAWLTVPDPSSAVALFQRARSALGDGISAFEIISGTGLAFQTETGMGVRQPFQDHPDWSVLIEIGLFGDNATGALETLYVDAAEAGLVLDGVVAASDTQRRELWRLRETMPEANRLIGAIASHDIAVPISELPDFIDEAGRAIAELAPLRINCFGHLGDGNLHYNLFPPKGGRREDFAHIREAASRLVHDIVDRKGGSFSAEHGIGRLKTADLIRYGDPIRIETMRRIKAALDPLGIMNPGAVLRPE